MSSCSSHHDDEVFCKLTIAMAQSQVSVLKPLSSLQLHGFTVTARTHLLQKTHCYSTHTVSTPWLLLLQHTLDVTVTVYTDTAQTVDVTVTVYTATTHTLSYMTVEKLLLIHSGTGSLTSFNMPVRKRLSVGLIKSFPRFLRDVFPTESTQGCVNEEMGGGADMDVLIYAREVCQEESVIKVQLNTDLTMNHCISLPTKSMSVHWMSSTLAN